MIKLPEYKGILLDDNSGLEVNILQGVFGQAIDNEVKEKNHKYVDIINATIFTDDVIHGSNPFYLIALNNLLEDQNLRIATQSDLFRIKKLKALDLYNVNYKEAAFTLGTIDGPNEYSAKRMYNQIKINHPTFNLDFPVMINLADLDLEEDQDSKYGLEFKFKQYSKVIIGKMLDFKYKFSINDVDLSLGLPIKTSANGQMDFRHYYPWDSGVYGLSRMLNLENSIILTADIWSLETSAKGGRIIVVRDHA